MRSWKSLRKDGRGKNFIEMKVILKDIIKRDQILLKIGIRRKGGEK